jgi:hypothetical protein
MGNDNHVVLGHKFCGFQGYVAGGVVVTKEPIVFVQKFPIFASHICSQVPQNFAVKVRVDRRVKRNKFSE